MIPILGFSLPRNITDTVKNINFPVTPSAAKPRHPITTSIRRERTEATKRLADDGTAVIRYENGGLGTVTASQISHGREADLEIEIDGTKGSLRWRQENPTELIYRQNGKAHQIYTPNPRASYMSASGAGVCRVPAAHPEAFFEAFANIYAAAFDDMAKRAAGEKIDRRDTIYPNVYDGVEGMNFIQQCVDSNNQDGGWLPLKHEAARRKGKSPVLPIFAGIALWRRADSR